MSLNPCCNGLQPSTMDGKNIIYVEVKVLILVVMDYSLVLDCTSVHLNRI